MPRASSFRIAALTLARSPAAQFLCYQDSLPSETGAMHCLNLYFECVATGDLRLNEESSEARWIGPDEVAELELVFRNGEALAAWFSRR